MPHIGCAERTRRSRDTIVGASTVAEASVGSKRCVHCGDDCSGKPRVKDPRGRYYCKGCYDTLEAARAAAPATTGDAPIDLLPIEPPPRPTASPPPRPRRHCPACRQPIEPHALACIGCGQDLVDELARPQGSGAWGNAGRPIAVTRADANDGGWRDAIVDPGRWIRWVATQGTLASEAAVLSFLIALAVMFGELPAMALGFAPLQRAPQRVADLFSLLVGSWFSFSLFVLAASTISAAICWIAGPWWFRLRVEWAGGRCAREPARIAYFASFVPYVVLLVPHLLLTYLSFRGPLDPAIATSAYMTTVAPILTTVALIATTGYLWLLAVRGFGAQPVRAALALVGLPTGLYLVRLLVGLTAAAPLNDSLAAYAERSFEVARVGQPDGQSQSHGGARPDARHRLPPIPRSDPNRLSAGESPAAAVAAAAVPRTAFSGDQFSPGARSPVRFTYPIGWAVTIEPRPRWSCDEIIVTHSLGWWVRIHIYPREDYEGSALQALDEIAASILAEGRNARMIEGIRSVGSRSGVGRIYATTDDAGTPIRHVIFAPDRPGSEPLYILEAVVPVTDGGPEHEGFETVAATLAGGF